MTFSNATIVTNWAAIDTSGIVPLDSPTSRGFPSYFQTAYATSRQGVQVVRDFRPPIKIQGPEDHAQQVPGTHRKGSN